MNFREVPERKKNEHATGHFDSGEYPCIGRSGCPQPEKERQALRLRLLGCAMAGKCAKDTREEEKHE